MPVDFPDVRDGDTIEPWWFNVIYRELRRWRKVKAVPPLAVSFAEGSASPVFSMGRIETIRIGKASGSISARSGSTYGTGTWTPQDDSGSALSNGGDPNQACKNLLDKTIATNSYLIVGWDGASWWVLAVGTCSNLS